MGLLNGSEFVGAILNYAPYLFGYSDENALYTQHRRRIRLESGLLKQAEMFTTQNIKRRNPATQVCEAMQQRPINGSRHQNVQGLQVAGQSMSERGERAQKRLRIRTRSRRRFHTVEIIDRASSDVERRIDYPLPGQLLASGPLLFQPISARFSLVCSKTGMVCEIHRAAKRSQPAEGLQPRRCLFAKRAFFLKHSAQHARGCHNEYAGCQSPHRSELVRSVFGGTFLAVSAEDPIPHVAGSPVNHELVRLANNCGLGHLPRDFALPNNEVLDRQRRPAPRPGQFSNAVLNPDTVLARPGELAREPGGFALNPRGRGLGIAYRTLAEQRELLGGRERRRRERGDYHQDQTHAKSPQSGQTSATLRACKTWARGRGGRSLDLDELSTDQRLALVDLVAIPRRSAYVPPPERQPHFQALVLLGLAKSRGLGLGGEGFAPTEVARRSLRNLDRQAGLGRGFASMSPERRREVARMGGAAVQPHKRAFSMNRDLASEAGRRGGEKSPGKRPKREGGDG